MSPSNHATLPRVLIAIPMYNCEMQIARVMSDLLRDLPKVNGYVFSVMAIDNCSSDKTLQNAQSFAPQFLGMGIDLRVLKNYKNLGLGGTQKNAFSMANAEGHDLLLIFHGDDQASTSDIQTLLQAHQQLPRKACILGSRFSFKSRRVGYSKVRTLGNIGLNLLYSLLTLRQIADLGSGINLYNLRDYSWNEYDLCSSGFTFNMDLLLWTIQKGYPLAYQPITWTETDQTSNARNFKVGWTALKTILQWRFSKRQQKQVLAVDDHLDTQSLLFTQLNIHQLAGLLIKGRPYLESQSSRVPLTQFEISFSHRDQMNQRAFPAHLYFSDLFTWRSFALAWLNGDDLKPFLSLSYDLRSSNDQHFPFLEIASPQRQFNELSVENDRVLKRSADKEKLKREFTFFQNIPAPLHKYYPQCEAMHEEAQAFSYSIQYVRAFDLSRFLLMGGIQRQEWQKVFDLLDRYFDSVPKKEASNEVYRQKLKTLFVDKLVERSELCKKISLDLPIVYQDLVKKVCQGFDKEIAKNSHSHLIFSHGDLCFSNILYDRTQEKILVIDPRGISTLDEAFQPLEYDFAKLAQCIFGDYDWIMAQNLDRPARYQQHSWLEPLVNELIYKYQISRQMIALGEASLFLSMIPLHQDQPHLHNLMIESAQKAIKRFEELNNGY